MDDAIQKLRPGFSKTFDAQTVDRVICTLILESRPDLIAARILTIGIRRDDEKDKFVELIEKRGLNPEVYSKGWEGGRALFHILFPEWRLYPYGFFLEPDGSIVIYDRNYCPIVRFKFGEQPEIVHPQERIQHRRIRDQRWFYESATSPISDPLTEPHIREIARFCGIQPELDYRSKISNHGKIQLDEWATFYKLPHDGR